MNTVKEWYVETLLRVVLIFSLGQKAPETVAIGHFLYTRRMVTPLVVNNCRRCIGQFVSSFMNSEAYIHIFSTDPK